jgi:lysozyme
MTSLLVADLSNNNSEFNAAAYRSAGHVLVALKASEGPHFADEKHRGWSLAAGLHHIAVMHYHFARPDLGTTGEQEADWFLHCTHGLRGPHDYVVYDGERARNGAFGLDAAHATQFDSRIQQQTRFLTILYGSASTLAGAGDVLIGDNRRDWDADYSTNRDTHAPGHECVLRQFTDGGVGPEPHSLPGTGRCDISIMRGRFAQDVIANSR